MARNRHNKSASQSLLDILIITGGRWDMLKKCLVALEAQENAPSFSVLIVDNNTDNKERLHNKDLFEMGIVSGTKRLTQDTGFAEANNVAARMGHSPLILCLNDDVELKPDAIKQMVDVLDRDEIGVVGAKLVFPENSKSGPAGKIQHVGMAMDISGNVTHPLIGWSPDNPKCCVSREVFAVTGACMMTRRSLWSEIGGFDLIYGLGTYEEVDYQMQVKARGKKVWLNVDAQGTHYTGATLYKKQELGKVSGYPIQQNAMIYKARWGQSGLFYWTDYKMW